MAIKKQATDRPVPLYYERSGSMV